GVGDERTVVLRVLHPVVVAVVVAGVPQAVVVGVFLAGVLHRRAVVARVGDAVAVAVDQRIAGVADPIVVDVGLVRIGLQGAVVGGVRHRVVLRGVEDLRAVIRSVGDPIAIGIDQRVAGIADPVIVDIRLVSIGDQRA